jgi:alkylation response protein AidB-like acyl-CoA dehydrogenase
LTEEHALLRREVAELSAKELAPSALEHDHSGTPPLELFAKMAELGFCAVAVPDAQGGAGMGTLAAVVVLEEVARVFPSLALSLAVQTVVGLAIAATMDPDLADLLSSVLRGKKIAAMSLTQDVLHASAGKEEIIGSGEIGFVGNGAFAQLLLVAVSGNGTLRWGVVETADPGCAIVAMQALGFRASGLTSMRCHSLRCKHWLLEKDRAQQFSAWRQLCLAAIAVGICQGCLDKSTRYAGERYQFGQPIGNFDMVRRLLAHVARRTASARLLTYDAAQRFDRLGHATEHVAHAFAWSRESAMLCADHAVQIFGGYGYTKDYPPEMFFRDAKFLEVLPPSVSEVQCVAI